MIMTTTPGIDGKRVETYLDIVTGEAIMGANMVRDFLAGITDIVGGRSGTYEEKFAEARRTALAEMRVKAATLQADAVIGIDLDYQVIGQMLMVSATGTAVRLARS